MSTEYFPPFCASLPLHVYWPKEPSNDFLPGLDRSGKSTQSKKLEEYLSKAGFVNLTQGDEMPAISGGIKQVANERNSACSLGW